MSKGKSSGNNGVALVIAIILGAGLFFGGAYMGWW